MTHQTLTPEELEAGLTHVNWMVRERYASREDFLPTPEQLERGLNDEVDFVQAVFLEKKRGWQAQWEAQELRKRHASVTAHKPQVETL